VQRNALRREGAPSLGRLGVLFGERYGLLGVAHPQVGLRCHAAPGHAGVAGAQALVAAPELLEVLQRLLRPALGQPQPPVCVEDRVDVHQLGQTGAVTAGLHHARRFLVKLDAAARQHVFLYLGAYCADAVLDPLWRHFHGAPRAPGPSYLDALAVLRELGIAPEVKVVELPNRRRYATVGEAVERYRDALLLADYPGGQRRARGAPDDVAAGSQGRVAVTAANPARGDHPLAAGRPRRSV